MELKELLINDVVPYGNNPRYNDEAVEAVAESISQVDYIAPIVVDENNQILAGHTRWKALYSLGREKIDCIVVEGLTEERKRKFRLLDNKTAEIATWDYEKLVDELDGLDFGDFGFFEKELSKMAEKEVAKYDSKKVEVVICPRCGAVVSSFVDMEEFEE